MVRTQKVNQITNEMSNQRKKLKRVIFRPLTSYEITLKLLTYY